MPYPKCKIYSDGRHYIAIPHTTRPYRPRRKPKEEVITVTEEVAEESQQPAAEQSAPFIEDAPMSLEETVSDTADCAEITNTFPERPTKNRLMTKKELFEELYAKYQSLPRYKRKAAILKRMRPYFKTEEEAKTYVEANMQRKQRNLMDEDVVCPFGLEDKKLLLYDDFLCWDEGVLVGAVSKAVINRMPKEN